MSVLVFDPLEQPHAAVPGGSPYAWVIVFDDDPIPKGVVDPNGTTRYNFPVTSTTGPRGAKGDPGDENVMVLEPNEVFDPTTPVGPSGYKIVYQLLEE